MDGKKFSNSCRQLSKGHKTLLPGIFILHCGHGEYLVSNRYQREGFAALSVSNQYQRRLCSTSDQQKIVRKKFDLLNIEAGELGVIKHHFIACTLVLNNLISLRIRICTIWRFQSPNIRGQGFKPPAGKGLGGTQYTSEMFNIYILFKYYNLQ